MASLRLSCLSRFLNVSREILGYLSCMHRLPFNTNLQCGRLLTQRFVFVYFAHDDFANTYTNRIVAQNCRLFAHS